ncbi:MAG TPA: serine/threonine-protein kinase [Kofleriaceae bacterium]|nr:serine/threonine-protein kinase [Kofleriaceae bacterium]
MLGRYELVRPLARGGMAELFLARRRGPGGVEKRLVIKRVRRERASDPRFIDMFVREARLSMSFAHKNIVPVFDFGRVGDELFLVMEYVDGVDLAAVLGRAPEGGAPPDPLVVAFIGEEACQALAYVHEAVGLATGSAVVHRDVSPSNVLLSYSGEVKLLDFGLATSETEIGRVRGTPAYMAPEQARGEPLDPRADVFALGLVLWEALAGRRAYAGPDQAAVLALARQGEVPPLDEERAPPPLRQIIERATRAAPDQRFADARAMQVALDEFLVDARAARERRTPAHQLLADWVRKLFPLPAPVPSEEVAVPAGPVATFLDDGEEEVAQARTARSVAATVGEVEPGPSPPAARPAPRRWPWALALVLAAGGAAAAAVSLWPRGSAPTAGAVLSDAAPARASAPPDAAPPAPDAAPPPAPDAAPAPAPPVARPPGKQRPPRAGDGGPSAGPPGTLQLDSTPWATVRIAGRRESCKETPCTLRLPPGTYRVRLANPLAHLEKEVQVTIESGRTVKVRESLTR